MEPKEKLIEIIAKLNLDKSSFITLKHGELNDF